MKTKAILYAYNSDNGNSFTSVLNQLQQLRSYCQQNNIKILDEISDFSSAWSSDPEVFRQYLDYTQSKIDACDLFLFIAPDPLAGNYKQVHEMARLLQTHGMNLKAIHNSEPSNVYGLFASICDQKM